MACSDPLRSSCWCCSYAVVVAVDVAAATTSTRCSVLLGEVVAVVAIIGGVVSLVAIVDVIISVAIAAAAAIVVVVWRSAAVLFGL